MWCRYGKKSEQFDLLADRPDAVHGIACEGRLQGAPENNTQRLALPVVGGKLVRRVCGILFSQVEHDGNTQGSGEEVERLQEIVRELLGRRLATRDRETRPLGFQDILFRRLFTIT
jgi:hypothetical protein